MKLTDAYIKKINHLDKDQFIRHDSQPGLVLRVLKYPSQSKTWYYQYRPKGKNPVRLKLGTYAELGIVRAVKRAQSMANDIFQGHDIYSARQKIKSENTLGEQIKEAYKTFTSPRYAPSTILAVKSIFKNYIFRRTTKQEIRNLYPQLPNIQHMKISKISNLQISNLHRIVGSRTPAQANRLVAYLNMFFNIWNERGITNNQPCKIKAQDKFEEEEYLDFLREDELRRVENILEATDKNGGYLYSHYFKHKLSIVGCSLISMQLYSGRRTKNELPPIMWSQIIMGQVPELRLTKTKTSKKNKKKNFPLGPDEMRILNLIKRDRLVKGEKSKFYYPPTDLRFNYVFPSNWYGLKTGPGKISSKPYLVDVSKTWKKVLKLAGIDRPMKNYATRHTHASLLLRKTGNLKAVADSLGITVKQASKYGKLLYDDVVEAKTRAFAKEPMSEDKKLKIV